MATRLTLKEIYKNAFGENLEGLNETQKDMARDAFGLYGDNFENAPDPAAEAANFNRAMIATMDDAQKEMLYLHTKPLAEEHTGKSYNGDYTKSDFVADMMDGLCAVVLFDDILFIPLYGAALAVDAVGSAAATEVAAGLAEGTAEAAGGAAEAAAEAGSGMLEGVGEVIGDIFSSISP